MFKLFKNKQIHKRGLKDGDKVWVDTNNKKVTIRNKKNQFILWPDKNNYAIFQTKKEKEVVFAIKLMAYSYGLNAIFLQDELDVNELIRCEIRNIEEY